MDFIIFRYSGHYIMYRNSKRKTAKVCKAIASRLHEIMGRPYSHDDSKTIQFIKDNSEHGHEFILEDNRFTMLGKGWTSANYPRAKLHYADLA